MAAKTKTRIKSPAVALQVPQSREQAADYIRQIGDLQRNLTRLQADMNDDLASRREAWEGQAQPLAEQIEARKTGLQTWCEANRDSLTQGGKTKTAAFTTGEIQWRMRPPSARITGAEAVMDVLRKLGLGRFIRTKDEVNKEAILNEPEAVAHVPGISISQGEDFVVTPFETDLAAQP